MKVSTSSLLHGIRGLIPLRRRASLRPAADRTAAVERENWSRVVMRRHCRELIEGLGPPRLRALEISGDGFANAGFAAYTSARYPDYDVCERALPQTFDLVIAEQVFEHLLWPYRAGRNVYRMLEAGGHFLISTPFLVRIHAEPVDCTRWTETGLRYFLAECGFALEDVRTWSWGNRACVAANFTEWVRYRPRVHSLHNEPEFPYHVWALARKQGG